MKVLSDQDLYKIRKESIESKSVHLNECVIIDDRYLTETTTTIDGQCVYQFQLKVSHKDFNNLKKDVAEAVRLFGVEPYQFDRPEGYETWGHSRQDEYRFRDQYLKTAILPVYSPNMQSYLIPKAQELILSSDECRTVFLSSLKPTKLIGDIPESGNFCGREASARCNIRIFESGKIYLSCNEMTVFAGNS